MRRRTPLRRGGLLRRAGIHPARRATGPTVDVVVLVLTRAGGCCERCGTGLGPVRGVDYSLHHRLARGMGGTRRAGINRPSNLLAVCGHGTSGCHGWVESHRVEAYVAGWLVRRGLDPVEHPVIVRGQRVLLTDSGRYYQVPAAGGAA